MRVAIYTRKSLEKEHSESIDTQIKLCKEYFRDKAEYEVFIDEGFSGGNTKRPAFQRMMKLVKLAKFDYVIVYKFDRFSRSIVDFVNNYNELENNNVKLVSYTERLDTSTAMGKMIMYNLANFAEFERASTQQRVKDNMYQLALKGCWTGVPTPKGYVTKKIEGKTYLELYNPEFVKDMFNFYNSYGTAYKAYDELKKKYKTYMFTDRSTLSIALRNPLYAPSTKLVSNYLVSKGYRIENKENGCGYLTYSNSVIVSRHQTPIDESTWLLTQKILDERKESYFKKESKVYWLSKILTCPFCGSAYQITHSGRNSYYVCSNRFSRKKVIVEKCSNSKYVNAEVIENEVEKFILSLKESEDFNEEYNKNNVIVEYDLKEKDIIKEIESNEKAISNLIEKMMILSKEASKFLVEKIEELTLRNSELNIKLQELKLNKLTEEEEKLNQEIVYKNICDFNKDMTPEEKRLMVRMIFDKLIYNPYEDTLEVEYL